jgi:hypothetical protein
MKNTVVCILCLWLSVVCTQAQDSTAAAKPIIKHWSWRGFFQVNFNQIALANWVAGGENSIAGTALTHYDFNYKNDDSTTRWENAIDLGYGLTRLAESGVRKNDDRIDLNTKYSKKATGKFNYSAIASFKSQFAPGYKYPNDSVVISKFMAPGYIIVSIGLDYRPNGYLSIYLSPATGKGTFVMDPALSDAGAFGVDKAVFDADGNKIRSGSRFRPEFGASLEARFKKDVMQNVNVQSRLNLFNNYTDKNISNRRNIDLNWETAINMKVNQYIAASLIIHMIYDDDIDIPVTRTVDGVRVSTTTGPRLQFKQALGVGFSYKFGRG